MPRFLAALSLILLFLSPIAAPAQTQIVYPAVVLPRDSTLKWHTIRFCYADPGDALALMGYAGGSVAGSPLPPGVARIFVVPSRNSLLVNANEDGFNRFKARLFQVLDRVPQQVQLQVIVASVSKSRRINLASSTAHEALDKLQEAHAVFYRQKPATAIGNTPITVTIDWPPVKSGLALPTLFVNPHLTGNNYVAMSVEFTLPAASGIPEAFAWVPVNMRFGNMSDIVEEPYGQPSGQMTFFDVTSRSPTAPNKIYLFLTLTILPPNPNDGSGIAIDP